MEFMYGNKMHAEVSVNDWECAAVKMDGVAEPQAVWAVNSRAVAYRESTQIRHKRKILFKVHRTSRKLVKKTKMADLY